MDAQRILHHPARKRRKPLRLKDYDYSLAGSYFVTICTKDHAYEFGDVVNGDMRRNNIVEITERCWKELPQHFPNIILDEFVVMPNHVHGIIVIVDEPDNHCTDIRRDVQLNIPTTNNYYSIISPKRNSLGVIVRTYKAAVTTICRQNGYTGFQWQRNYYEHIIRNEKASNKIRNYIFNNPVQWEFDKENPIFEGSDEFNCWLIEEGKRNIQLHKEK